MNSITSLTELNKLLKDENFRLRNAEVFLEDGLMRKDIAVEQFLEDLALRPLVNAKELRNADYALSLLVTHRGETYAPLLVGLLTDPARKYSAIVQLVRVHYRPALETLVRLLEHETNHYEILSLLGAISSSGKLEAAKVLQEYQTHPHPEIRKYAIGTLILLSKDYDKIELLDSIVDSLNVERVKNVRFHIIHALKVAYPERFAQLSLP